MRSLERANVCGTTSSPGGLASPMRRAAVQKGDLEASAEDSLFRRRIPCSDREIPCFQMEQGIRCKPLNPFGKRRQKPLKEAGIGRSLKEFPVNFPVFRECAAAASSQHHEACEHGCSPLLRS